MEVPSKYRWLWFVHLHLVAIPGAEGEEVVIEEEEEALVEEEVAVEEDLVVEEEVDLAVEVEADEVLEDVGAEADLEDEEDDFIMNEIDICIFYVW